MNPMIIKTEKPPIYDSIVATFGIIPHNVVYTYGEALYNPDHLEVRDDVIEHEKVHRAQQNANDIDAALWWGKYLRDKDFRIDQEARAYAVQYAYIIRHNKASNNRNWRTRILFDLARSLSGPLYGGSINHIVARTLILKYAKL